MHQPSIGSVIILLLIFGFITEYFSSPNIIDSIQTTMANYGFDNKFGLYVIELLVKFKTIGAIVFTLMAYSFYNQMMKLYYEPKPLFWGIVLSFITFTLWRSVWFILSINISGRDNINQNETIIENNTTLNNTEP